MFSNIDALSVVTDELSGTPTSMLDAETRYLPLPSDLNMSPLVPFNLRPSTAPGVTTGGAAGGETSDPPRPGTAGARQHSRSRIAANFPTTGATSTNKPTVKPTRSELQPQSHMSKRAASPVTTKALEFIDDSEVTDQSASLELKVLKAILASRNKKQKSSGKKSVDHPVDHQENGNTRPTYYSSPKSVPAARKGQYTPEKYTSPTRKSHRASPSPTRKSHSHRTSSSNSQPISTSSLDNRARRSAAVKIQAAWRGYSARNNNPTVLKVRQEVRTRRTEEHIAYLKSELDR